MERYSMDAEWSQRERQGVFSNGQDSIVAEQRRPHESVKKEINRCRCGVTALSLVSSDRLKSCYYWGLTLCHCVTEAIY